MMTLLFPDLIYSMAKRKQKKNKKWSILRWCSKNNPVLQHFVTCQSLSDRLREF